MGTGFSTSVVLYLNNLDDLKKSLELLRAAKHKLPPPVKQPASHSFTKQINIYQIFAVYQVLLKKQKE